MSNDLPVSPAPAIAPDEPVARLGDRALFPALEPRAYLNHSAISPPSRPVTEVMGRVMHEFARLGVSALFPWLERREVLRGQLARMIGAAPGDIGLTHNTSHGVTSVALCLPWKTGDRVLLFTGEFPANVTPWQQAAALFGLEITFLPLDDFRQDPGRGLQRLEDALRESNRGRARLVAVSHVQFQTGLRMPIGDLARLCHAHGAELFVDAIQACGAVPVDVRDGPIDYLSAGGHKWLMGPEGTGFLYARPERARALVPRTASWISHEAPFEFLFAGPGHLRYDRPIKSSARFVEGAAANTVGLAGLGVAVRLLEQLGAAAIFDHVQRYLDALERSLTARGFRSARCPTPAGRSAILSVTPPDDRDVVALQHGLAARGVACSTPDGFLRFAPHWPNNAREVPLILDSVDALLAGEP